VAFVIQVLIGLQTFLSLGTGEQAPLVVVHVFLATTIWAAAVALTVLFFKARAGAKVAAGENAEIAKGPSSSIKAYFLLTKPRIIELLLITTVPAMVVAARGWPSTTLVIATVFGGALAAGSANSINSFVDRDIDDRMERTKRRPLPQNTIKPRRALIFGITLGVIAFAFLVTFVNLLAATLATSGILFYVFVYTIWLKRSTPSNIVIGGAAGAVPPLVGWAAVTDGLSIVPLVLFAVVFYWTPPHFWALAIKYSPEYEAAGVPMLPVVRGPKETGRQIFWYSLVLLAVSLLLAPTARLGSLYLMSAIVLGAAFVFYALRVQADPTPQRAMALFRYSITYLVLIFVSMAVDASVGSPMVISEAWVFVVAAPIFLGAQAMVMFSVLGFGEFRGRIQLSGSELGAEIAWTAVPSLLVAALFVFAWQSLIA
jgi:protoheme IX farnesyltransferase